MTTHRLKIQEQYADAVLNGTKTFEIRKNDRGYEVGDKIVFDVVTNEGYAVGAAARHPLNGAAYRIDYILDGFEGLADLIDRGECENVYDENEMGACDNGFECSVCGCRVEDEEHYHVSGVWNNCPQCGRTVVKP